jgi:hypothetical protein
MAEFSLVDVRMSRPRSRAGGRMSLLENAWEHALVALRRQVPSARNSWGVVDCRSNDCPLRSGSWTSGSRLT